MWGVITYFGLYLSFKAGDMRRVFIDPISRHFSKPPRDDVISAQCAPLKIEARILRCFLGRVIPAAFYALLMVPCSQLLYILKEKKLQFTVGFEFFLSIQHFGRYDW